MGEVIRLWNPGSGPQLRRYWVRCAEGIVVRGGSPQTTGVLTLTVPDEDRVEVALQVQGAQFVESVPRGNDISIRINDLYMILSVKAVAEDALLVSFGVPHGAEVYVVLAADGIVRPRACDSDEPTATATGFTGLGQVRG